MCGKGIELGEMVCNTISPNKIAVFGVQQENFNIVNGIDAVKNRLVFLQNVKLRMVAILLEIDIASQRNLAFF